MRHAIKTYISLLLLILAACNQQDDKSNLEKALSNATEKFPQLPKGKLNQTDFYKLVRTVSFGKPTIQLQFYTTPGTIKDAQQVVLLINPEGDCYAIPLFSNTYRDYWNFEFDKPDPGVKKVNTTFEKEFMNAIDSLHLNDTIGTGSRILVELLTSVMHCKAVHESDSTQLTENVLLTANADELQSEHMDSCDIRECENFEVIRKAIHPSEYFYNNCAFWDESNNRVFLLNDPVFSKKDRKKKYKLSLKTFRLGCTVQPIYM